MAPQAGHHKPVKTNNKSQKLVVKNVKEPKKQSPLDDLLNKPITSIEEAALLQMHLARELLQAQTIELDLANKYEKLKNEARAKITPCRKRAIDLARVIYRFAEAYKGDLIGDGLKTVYIPHAGTMRWYDTPSTVEATKPEEELIVMLERIGLTRFIRIKKELDKAALEKEPSVVKELDGLHIEPKKEKFVISPLLKPPAAQTTLERFVNSKDVWAIVTPKKKEKM